MKMRLFRKVRAAAIYATRGPEGLKKFQELRVWNARLGMDEWLNRDRYEYLYTDFTGLDKSYYSGKRILDIGCGPWGSLEWADMASIRVGLDPIAHDYQREFGTNNHKMQYVSAGAEKIPFPDECFDVVSSFVSLKHVIGIEEAINEIVRVTSPGGIFLLQTTINRPSTSREPTTITWDLVRKFQQHMELSQGYYAPSRHGVKGSDITWLPYDRQVESPQRTSLKALFVKA